MYCLLPNKTKETYIRLLTEVKRLLPDSGPESILTDLEIAAMSAFSEVYPSAQIRGCYFHLAQNVLRKVQEVGLKGMYESDDAVRGFIRCLPALSHVPPEDVIDAFETLADTMPNIQHVDEVVSYFEHTYVRGRRLRGRVENYAPPLFAVNIWNQHTAAADGIARTNNSCEGWHHAIHSLMQCDHPTLWRFIQGLQLDCGLQLTSYLQGAAGTQHPVKKRYRVLREKVQRVMTGYQRADVLTFLRAIAFLSHS